MPIGNLRLRNIFHPDALQAVDSLMSPPQSMNQSPDQMFGGPQQPQYVPQLPPFQVPPMNQQVQGAEPNDYDRMQEIFQGLYQPETTNIDRMNTLLGKIPQRTEPSALRRIGAVMAGISGGPRAQEEAKY